MGMLRWLKAGAVCRYEFPAVIPIAIPRGEDKPLHVTKATRNLRLSTPLSRHQNRAGRLLVVASTSTSTTSSTPTTVGAVVPCARSEMISTMSAVRVDPCRPSDRNGSSYARCALRIMANDHCACWRRWIAAVTRGGLCGLVWSRYDTGCSS